MKSAEKVVLYRLAASLLLTASTLHLLGLPAWPHGGGLDKYGCHHNRLHVGYHCHRGIFKGSMFDSQAEMLQTLETPNRSPTKPDQPAPIVVQEFSGRVVGVADGDTITVLHNGKGERIRLNGIDCPEKRQAFGNRAKQFTSNLVFAKTVTVQAVDRDRYGRTVGVVLLPDGRSLNHELVRAGQPLLIRGGTSSIGMATTVLAKDLGLTIAATTRNRAKVEALKGNGADYVVGRAGIEPAAR